MNESPNRALQIFYWSCIILLAVGWHAVWFLAFPTIAEAHLPTATQDREPLSIQYLEAPQAQEAGDTEFLYERAMWSPVLFALPTQFGYSQCMNTKPFGMGPPIHIASQTPRLLDIDWAIPRPAQPVGFDLEAEAQGQLDNLKWRQTRGAAFKTVKTTSPSAGAIHVRFSNGLVEDDFSSLPIDGYEPVESEAFRFEVEIDIDQSDVLTHVYIKEAPAQDWARDKLIRLLYQWQPTRKGFPRSGTVILERKQL